MELSKPGFWSLPMEIMEKIIECNVISYVELCRLSRASRIFHPVTNNNEVWKNHYLQMWPDLVDMYYGDPDWKSEFRRRLDYKVVIHACLKKLSGHFHSDSILELFDLQTTEIVYHHSLGMCIILDEVMGLIDAADKFHNLTVQYCAKRVFREMKQNYFQDAWRSFLSREPPTIIILTTGACLMAGWLRSADVECLENVNSEIYLLSEKVFQEVARRSPNHSLIRNGMPNFGEIRESSCWSPHECRVILRCINTVMFEELEFSAHSYIQCADDIMIDEVLRKRVGISELIAIVYKVVADILGVICLAEGFAGYFYLKWLERPHLHGVDAYTFIDVNNKGAFRSWDAVCNSTPSSRGNRRHWYRAYEPLIILAEMCLEFIDAVPAFLDGDSILFMRNAVQLLILFNLESVQSELSQAIIYTELEGTYSLYFRRSADKEVKYAVGMIMRHRMSNKRCVIYAWQTPSIDIEEDDNHQIDAFVPSSFSYCVLFEGGLKQLVDEEELEIDGTHEPISNGEVGRYFESFNGRFYIPNHYTDLQYPEDAKARERIFRR